MTIGSVEGLLVTLLMIVPGGLGSTLRRSFYPMQAPSAFAELMYALAAALLALLTVEFIFTAFSREPFGNQLLVPLVTQDESELDWNLGAYAPFFLIALGYPTLGAWLRRLPRVQALFGVISPHADGLDLILREALPSRARAGIWITVNTEDDEALLGQLMWRSTAPDPVQLVLGRVRDLN
ncbi:MAG: DUF6338 family protein [Actinomycetota bacterium]